MVTFYHLFSTLKKAGILTQIAQETEFCREAEAAGMLVEVKRLTRQIQRLDDDRADLLLQWANLVCPLRPGDTVQINGKGRLMVVRDIGARRTAEGWEWYVIGPRVSQNPVKRGALIRVDAVLKQWEWEHQASTWKHNREFVSDADGNGSD